MNPRDKQAYMNATPMQREVVRRLLCDVLGCLRAQYLSYQTSHWQVVGQSFYGNHLLFARLYESVQAQVDQLAEKLVGYLGREVVGLDHQIKHIAGYTMRWSQIDCHHKRGLQSEADLQAALKRAYDGIKQIHAMTLGLDDWIMATANAHEENEYLLQQALTPVPGRQASKKASTNTERYYYKATDGKWYVENEEYEEDWDTGEQIEGDMTHYGPFPSFDAAEKYMRRNFANSGSYSKDDSGRMKPPRNPVKPGRSRRLWGSGPRLAFNKYNPDDLLAALVDILEKYELDDAVDEVKKITRTVQTAWRGRERTASGAPSAEGDFYDNAMRKEVLDFAQTGAISNFPEVAEAASEEDQLDIPEAEAVAEAEEAPPTPTEIAEEPGGAAVSTLNRLVIQSEDPDAAKAAEINRTRMAAWLKELDRG
jgi:DNA-binding ferritin-like protein